MFPFFSTILLNTWWWGVWNPWMFSQNMFRGSNTCSKGIWRFRVERILKPNRNHHRDVCWMIWPFNPEVFLFLSLLLVGSTRHCADVGLCSAFFLWGQGFVMFLMGPNFSFGIHEKETRAQNFPSFPTKIGSGLCMMNNFGWINASKIPILNLDRLYDFQGFPASFFTGFGDFGSKPTQIIVARILKDFFWR